MQRPLRTKWHPALPRARSASSHTPRPSALPCTATSPAPHLHLALWHCALRSRYRRLYCSPRPRVPCGSDVGALAAALPAWGEPTGVCESPGLSEALSLMRLSGYDPDFFVVSGVASSLQQRALSGCWVAHKHSQPANAHTAAGAAGTVAPRHLGAPALLPPNAHTCGLMPAELASLKRVCGSYCCVCQAPGASTIRALLI